jgi:hypothetical protein
VAAGARAYEFRVVHTRYPSRLGFHCHGLQTRDDVYSFLKPLAEAGWRVSNVFESTERGFEWYVHVRRQAADETPDRESLLRALREIAEAQSLRETALATRRLPRGEARPTPPPARVQSHPPAARSRHANVPALSHEAPARSEPAAVVSAPSSWEQFRAAWLETLDRDLLAEGGIAELQNHRIQVEALVRSLETEANWRLAREFLRHDMPEALDLLSPGVASKFDTQPEFIYKAILLAAGEPGREEFIVRLWDEGRHTSDARVCYAVAHACRKLNRDQDSLSAIRLAASDSTARPSPEDMALKAEVLNKLDRKRECVQATREAIDAGKIPVEVLADLAINEDLSAEEITDLVFRAWSHADNRDVVRELVFPLFASVEALEKQTHPNADTLLRQLTALCEAKLVTEGTDSAWGDVDDLALKANLPLPCIVGLLDFLGAEDPEGALSRLTAYLAGLSPRRRRERPSVDELKLMQDLLEFLNGDTGLLNDVWPSPTPIVALETTLRPDVSVLLVGATANIRSQVAGKLSERFGIHKVDEVLSPWEGTTETTRIRNLVRGRDLIVVSTSMMTHSLWHQVDVGSRERAKFVYPPSGGVTGTLAAVQKWLLANPSA